MIDAEALIYRLLRRDVDEAVAVSADVDVDALSQLPYLTFTVSGDGQASNSDGVWTFNLTISVFAEGMDATKDLARSVYDTVHHWDEVPSSTVIEDLGWIGYLEDIDVFSRTSSAYIGGRNTTQYVGSFALALRNNQ